MKWKFLVKPPSHFSEAILIWEIKSKAKENGFFRENPLEINIFLMISLEIQFPRSDLQTRGSQRRRLRSPDPRINSSTREAI